MPVWIADAPAAFVAPTKGCRWPVISTCDVEIAEGDEAALELFGWMTQAAIETLWQASGRRYGICGRTIRPCLPDCDPGWQNTAWSMIGQRAPGAPLDIRLAACGRCGWKRCSCSAVHEIELWNHDVRSVTEVVIDGFVLGRSLYHRAGRFLVRHAGETVHADFDAAVQVGADVEVDAGNGLTLTITDAQSVGAGGVILTTGDAPMISLPGYRDFMMTFAGQPGLQFSLSVVPQSVEGITYDTDISQWVIDGSGDESVLFTITYSEGVNVTMDIVAAVPETIIVLGAVQWSDTSLPNPGWPKCQDRNVQAGDIGSWTVSYLYGKRVPVMGQIAAGVLACEYYKAVTPDAGECALPEHIKSRVIEGQTIGYFDPLTVLNEGIVGMGGVVDQFIVRSNPNRLQRGARAFRADDPRRIRGRR